MSGYAWLRNTAIFAIGVSFVILLASPDAWSKKKPQPTPTATVTATPTATPEVHVWNFDSEKAGSEPTGWKQIAGSWIIQADASAPSTPNTIALQGGLGAQATALVHGLNYPLVAILDQPTEYGDFTLEVSYKPVIGRFDCSGGIVFRYVDTSNYYVLAAGCPNDYFTLSREFNGTPSILQQKVVPIDQGAWYKIKVEVQGDHFTCYNDNKMIFDFNDSKIAKGKFGLYGANDSLAEFDNLTLTLPLVMGAPAGGASPAASPAPAALPPPP